MREFFIVFRSRSEAARFYGVLADYGISAKLINTPSSAGVGCGLSVKCLVKNLKTVTQALERGRFGSVVGKYYIADDGRSVKF